MKEKMLDVLLFVGVVIALIGCVKMLQWQDQKNYEYAVERCGSEENLVKHYTNEGDVYWTCKVEKNKKNF